METEILEQIVISLESWKDLNKVGEEVRAMEDTIRSKVEHNIDPVMEALLDLIQTHKNDYELGRIIRTIYIPIRTLLDDTQDT
jgi:uncharacterized protein Yka (UPF0111/DUF47 family)